MKRMVKARSGCRMLPGGVTNELSKSVTEMPWGSDRPSDPAFRVAGNLACRRPFRPPFRYATNFSGGAVSTLEDAKLKRTALVSCKGGLESPQAGKIACHTSTSYMDGMNAQTRASSARLDKRKHVPPQSVETSLDAADTSVRATSGANGSSARMAKAETAAGKAACRQDCLPH
jgi:hypothetical protein